MIEGHGDDRYRYDVPIVADFSSNVHPGGPSPAVLEHVIRHLAEAGRYPEPEGASLRRRVARFANREEEGVAVTSGAVEALYLVASAYRGGRALVAVPSFREYEDACRVNDLEVRFIHWDGFGEGEGAQAGYGAPLARELEQGGYFVDSTGEDLAGRWSRELERYRPDLFFICNPNNPTGDLLTLSRIRQLLVASPSTLVVVDEAYMDFARGGSSSLSLLDEFSNLLVVRSLTKSFALPGLRLGYMAAAPEVMRRIRSRRPPWSVSTPALLAGEYIFEHYEELLFARDSLLEEAKSFMEALFSLEGVRLRAGSTHYFTLRLERVRAAELKDRLARERGLLIRDASNFRGMDSSHIRIASLDRERNRLLVEALQDGRLAP